MGEIGRRLEELPWTTWEIPLAFRRVAARLDSELGDQTPAALARGFVDRHECLVVLLRDALVVGEARTFSTHLERWPIPGFALTTSREGPRIVLELTATGRRRLARLLDEAPSEAMARAIDERLNPRPQMTFVPYAGRP